MVKKNDSSNKPAKPSVSLDDFLNVTIAYRSEFDSALEAAKALGLTPASFKQRLKTERDRYPEMYADVPAYANDGRTKATKAQAAAILVKLQEAKAEKEKAKAEKEKAKAEKEEATASPKQK